MKIDIVMKPVFDLHLSHKAVKLLMLISDAHYDGRCKGAGKVGGFLYGWNNSADFLGDMEDPLVCRATPHEIDTLVKTCEVARSMLEPADMAVINDFRTSCAAVMVSAGVWSGPIAIGATDV